jgi:hypothetical protein
MGTIEYRRRLAHSGTRTVSPLVSSCSMTLCRLSNIFSVYKKVRVPGYRSGGPEFDSRHYKKKVVSLERGPLRIVSTTEELLGRNNSGSGLESREYDRRDSSR